MAVPEGINEQAVTDWLVANTPPQGPDPTRHRPLTEDLLREARDQLTVAAQRRDVDVPESDELIEV